MPYGYLGTTPNQQKANSGVFSVEEALALQNVGELGGSLNLIDTYTASSSSTLNLTAIKESKYNVHLLQILNLTHGESSQKYMEMRFSNDGGSSFEDSNYNRAVDYAGSSYGVNGTNTATEMLLAIGAQNESMNAYMYLYNLGDSAKYSFTTHQSTVGFADSTNYWSYLGGHTYRVAETINAIQIRIDNGGNFSATAKLFGLKDIEN